uniref:Uncharacterized protein n=1 Tax=Trichobilharzia regenti TaxID=157069 RepID=A0AA85JCG4_TRIRE|nr:unnamed protein product [Trichobilharzia regenti]
MYMRMMGSITKFRTTLSSKRGEFRMIDENVQSQIAYLLHCIYVKQRWDTDRKDALSQIRHSIKKWYHSFIPKDLPSPSCLNPLKQEAYNCNAFIYSLSSLSPTLSSRSDDLIIIGAGQMRTGTTSLKAALEILYNQPCYHMSDIVKQYKEPHIKKWLKLFNNQLTMNTGKTAPQIDKTDWQEIYGRCKFAVDYPSCLFYKELMKTYPNAKVILTIRDADSWVSSCRATTASNLVMKKNPTLTERLIYRLRGLQSLPQLHDKMFTKAFGSNYDQMTNAELKQAYLQWNQNVIKSVPNDRLLIFNPKQGWQTLCEFLHIPIPQNIDFPHLNKKVDMRRNLLKYQHLADIMNFTATLFIFLFVCYFFNKICALT